MRISAAKLHSLRQTTKYFSKKMMFFQCCRCVSVTLWFVSDELSIRARSVFVSEDGVTGRVRGGSGLTFSWQCRV